MPFQFATGSFELSAIETAQRVSPDPEQTLQVILLMSVITPARNTGLQRLYKERTTAILRCFTDGQELTPVEGNNLPGRMKIIIQFVIASIDTKHPLHLVTP